jgi:uncharacterized protein YggE
MRVRHARIPVVVGLVLLGLLVATTRMATAQEPTSGGVTTVGVGEASAPADTAHLQIVIATGDAFMMPEEAEVDASPAAAEEEDFATQLAPIVDAIVDQGIERSVAAVVVSPTGDEPFGPGRPSAGRIDVTVADPTRDGLDALLKAVASAADERGLFVDQVGAAYEVDDCAAIEREAREAAIADARARAEVQAELLGVRIGPVTASVDAPHAGLFGGAGCGFEGGGTYISEGYGVPVTLPTYDPGAEPEVEVYVLITLTFAIAQG